MLFAMLGKIYYTKKEIEQIEASRLNFIMHSPIHNLDNNGILMK